MSGTNFLAVLLLRVAAVALYQARLARPTLSELTYSNALPLHHHSAGISGAVFCVIATNWKSCFMPF